MRITIIFVTWLLVGPLSALAQLFEPELRIISIGARHGDCTLIIARALDTDGKQRVISTLIDTGSFYLFSDGGVRDPKELWETIWERITAAKGNQLDYYVISHLHEDHAGISSELLRAIAKDPRSRDWRKKMIIVDRVALDAFSGYPRWELPVSRNKPDPLPPADYFMNNPPLPPAPAQPPPKKPKDSVLREHLTTVNRLFPRQKRALFPGQDLWRTFVNYKLQDFQMVCVATAGFIGPRRFAAAKDDSAKILAPVNENDLSSGFLIRFGSFRYFTGGDLNDTMEKPLVERLSRAWSAKYSARFHTCALKVSHHGSDGSTSPEFLGYFNPAIAVFQAGLRRFSVGGTRLPTSDTIRRLRDNGTISRFTFRIGVLGSAGLVSGNDDPSRTSIPYTDWLPNRRTQDIVLTVKEEKSFGGSPLVNGQAPRMRLYYRQRDLITGRPLDPIDIPYDSDSVPCNRQPHENVPLPY